MNKILAAAAVLSLSTGCMYRSTPVVNSVDVTNVDWTNVAQMKHGTGCATLLFGFIPVGGSASLVRAVEHADISKVTVLSNRYKNFIIYSQSCVEVWGE